MKNNKLIKDIAIVYTSSSYQLLNMNDSVDSRYIYVAKKFVYGESFFPMLRGTCPNDGFIVQAKEGIDLSYIAFILNSVITAVYLTGNNLSKSISLSKKRIETIPVRETDDATMYILGLSSRMVQASHSFMEKEPEKDIFRFHYSVLSELRDGLALEFLTQPLFDKLGVHILDAWVNYLDNYDGRIKIPVVVSQLLDDDNEVMNQIKKMRLVITNISKLLEDSKS